MNPENAARMLLSYYQSQPNGLPLIVDMISPESDNGYISEILLIIYKECQRIYRDEGTFTHSQFTNCIGYVFSSLGYRLILKKYPRSELSKIIYYARIQQNLNMTLCRYHPLILHECMTKIIDQNPNERLVIPDSFSKLFNDSDYLPNIVSVHETDSDHSDVVLISFQKLNIHIPGQDSTVSLAEMVDSVLEQLDTSDDSDTDSWDIDASESSSETSSET